VTRRTGWTFNASDPGRGGSFSLFLNVKTSSGAHAASYSGGTGYRNSFLGVKWPGREADHSCSSAEVKNEWSYTSAPPHMFL
jgi:hypothetical protein